MVYDVTSAESFVNVKRWLHEINQNCDDVCRILGEAGPPGVGTVAWRVTRGYSCRAGLTVLCLEVGNKNDDPERKVVETEDAYKFAGQMGIQLFETSAKENVNVEEVRPGPRGRGAREGVGPSSVSPLQSSSLQSTWLPDKIS